MSLKKKGDKMRKKTIKNIKVLKVKKAGNKTQKEKTSSLLTQSNVKSLLLSKQQLKLKMSRFDDNQSFNNKSGVFIENLINVETTAEVLGVAQKTIRKWISIRFIPYLKLGSRVLFRPKSLELWLNRKENKSWL